MRLPTMAAIVCLLMAHADARGQAVPASPEDGGPRRFEVAASALNLREGPSASAPSVGQFESGDILYNLGCEEGDGRAWCQVQELGGGPVGFVAADYLRPAVGPDGAAVMGPDDSALRAGQGQFDAQGYLRCTYAAGQPATNCEFGVARAGGGDATVVVKRGNSATRAIYFMRGVAIGADTAEAEGMPPFGVRRQSGFHYVTVGEERYEIPDVVIFDD